MLYSSFLLLYLHHHLLHPSDLPPFTPSSSSISFLSLPHLPAILPPPPSPSAPSPPLPLPPPPPQPSLLSSEPLLPPHNFHSHSLRRLPLYQPLQISQPMPASLSVGQPALPPLPAHRMAPRAPPASLSPPPRVQPFLSLPRQQPSYMLDQVGISSRTGILCFLS